MHPRPLKEGRRERRFDTKFPCVCAVSIWCFLLFGFIQISCMYVKGKWKHSFCRQRNAIILSLKAHRPWKDHWSSDLHAGWSDIHMMAAISYINPETKLHYIVKCSDRGDGGGAPPPTSREVHWTLSFRGRRSHNKVFVGEPAEGSLSWPLNKIDHEHVIHVVGLWSGQGHSPSLHWWGAAKEPTTPKVSRNTGIALLGVMFGRPVMPCAMLLS